MPNLNLEYPQAFRGCERYFRQAACMQSCVREIGQAMSGHLQVQLPSQVARLLIGILIEIAARNLLSEPSVSNAIEYLADIVHGAVHIRIGAHSEGFTTISLPLLPYGTDVDEVDVVFQQFDTRLGGLAELLERVDSEAHVDAVPAPDHFKVLQYLPSVLHRGVLERPGQNHGGDPLNRFSRALPRLDDHLPIIAPSNRFGLRSHCRLHRVSASDRKNRKDAQNVSYAHH